MEAPANLEFTPQRTRFDLAAALQLLAGGPVIMRQAELLTFRRHMKEEIASAKAQGKKLFHTTKHSDSPLKFRVWMEGTPRKRTESAD